MFFNKRTEELIDVTIHKDVCVMSREMNVMADLRLFLVFNCLVLILLMVVCVLHCAFELKYA